MKEYKVVIYQESLLSSLFFGAAKVNPVNFSAFLNKQIPRRLAGRNDGKRFAPYAAVFQTRGLRRHFGAGSCLSSAFMPVSDCLPAGCCC
ncbi:Uncharacterised protein [Neisseria meningitidis]|uniref:Uncharacterized protein n=1 Tax=Neisseria meningitidis TaxID=487 RepID=A0AB33TXV9_NEIME|nr:conserved hypothetical protein [Neisseria meningitidis M01-240149]ADZ04428.1 hypothetical protein NMBNZ0533_2060 [Neisseria meningitidis NZ-05/33]AKM92520.1 hypothetical protein M0579_01033 [Neisseria meningitidis M0579]ANW88499.1 hypothetical protein DE8669_2127 [Neisseria meningitidis]EGC52083.1 hypothetical protein NMBOX9930304_1949 [Neisseria meningitidis OX99.30304]EJU62057.1 hypothetical protein NMEN69166_2091 [Neisseria meningitidis 69166]EJU68295.1 hypothetical protein NMEN80179_21